MPALILLHKREEEDAVDANRNHHHVLLPKARHRRCTHHSVEGDSGDDETSTIFEGDEAAIWIPPEAADILDDDEFDDGRSWGQFPNIHREERQNAMLKAMNGQLKILAARFLASVGISLPQGEGEDERSSSWLDIVASLSWEAALLIKPDSGVGKDMDPASYIKVKCVPSGTRRQCEVIKGLVFKKNAAHKHMPTWCHNARLLLLRGILGDSDAGFSSFSSMEQEKDHLQKSVCKMMEICSPNVIMVEKTVSRDIQELLLKQGVTLVLDMKLNRLQRIARFSGSSILSFSEVLSNNPKLKQCDYFHIEKVMEEQNHTSGVGKRALPKTLLFLEGFHKPSGCTILLRGGNREELKKIKQVMHYTVFAAYHLVLETSFFEDQRVFLNNKNPSKGAISFSAMPRPSVIHRETSTPSNGSLPVSPEDNNASTLKLYLETHDGSVERPNDGDTATISSISPAALSSPNKEVPSELPEGAVTGCDSNQAVSSERLASSVSGSRKRFIDMFCHQNIYLPFTSSYESTNDLEEVSLRNSQEVAGSNFHISPKARVPVGSGQNVDHSVDPQKQASSETDCQSNDHSTSEKQEQAPITLENEQHHNTGYFSGDWTSDTDEGDDVLESQSILILMSSQCNTKQVICEQSHLSRIKYYGNFDVSLGRYLQDILQSQNLSCSSCGEPPGAHMYSYTHRNGNLTVLVKRLLPPYHLPSESEGKIWMWTRCLRCEHENGISKSSRRVLISSEARNLSFGKFLELSFSSHSAARRLSICGHLVNRDCLRFFGLGSKVAMFQYSSVEIYTAYKPQPTLEFHNPSMHEWYEQERRNVLARGAVLFSEVRRLLFHMKDQFLGVANNCTAFVPIKEFSQLEEMLTKEKSEFMDFVTKAVDPSGTPSSMHEILNVNWLYQDLLLELYVWDRRLHQLLECLYAKIEEAGYDMETEISGFRGDQTAAVAEADIPSLENGSVEPEKLSGLGTKLVDEKPWYEEQHGTEVPCFDTSLKQFRISQPDDREKWVWNPLYESRLAYRQEVQVGFLERFELVNHYSPFHLSPLHNQSAEEVISAQFLVGPGGNVLCVSDDEISSIISRALAVSEERRQLLDAIVGSEAADIRGRERSKTMEKSDSSISETSSASSSSSWSTGGSSDSEAGSSSDDLSGNDSTLLPSSLHPEISVNGKGKYSVICVHADQFYNLRKKCCPSEIAYIASLSRCKRWDAQGGKSKAFFAKTMDDRFIVKQIKKTEFESFIEFAPGYFKHVCHSLDTGSQTCLAKILGIYQVKQIKHGKEVKIDLMVMENLLFGHNVSRIYDLKGVVFSRHVSHSNDHDTVYLDQNFVEDMRVSPIYIGGKTKHLLQRAIWNDTSFLTSINVMDYSLLVGVDKQKHEFVFGIIDYLRQYTWDKQLETWVKTSLVVPKNVSPTVVSPREYKKRFRKFMTKYFVTVPDDWSSENRTMSCKSCAHSNSKLPLVNDERSPHQIVACA